MKNLRRIFVYIIISVILSGFNFVYAEQCAITCSTQAHGTDVTISGQIQNATEENQVTLLVGETDNIIYINQTQSLKTGEFEFNFKLSKTIPEEGYAFKIGSDSGAETYTGILKETKEPVAVQNKFLKAHIEIGIDGYEPNIWGPICCTDGTTVTIKIFDKTDNVVMSEEIITSEDDAYYLDYILPSLLTRKEYEVTVTCKDSEEKILSEMSVNIDSHILTVSVDGQVSTASDVTIDAELKTTNTDFMDKQTSFTGSEEVNVTIPNLAMDAHFQFILDGYKTIYCEKGSAFSGEYILNITGQEDVPLFDVAVNVANIDNVNDKIFIIDYPLLYFIVNDVSTYPQNNISIIENKPGILKYKVNENIPAGKLLTKTMNVIRFYSGSSGGDYKIKCTVREEEIK